MALRKVLACYIGRRCQPGSRCMSKNTVYVGKADKDSNIRPLLCERSSDDTKLETRLKDLREESQQWHIKFWKQHNINYSKSREEFVEKFLENRGFRKDSGQPAPTVYPDDMSVFHRDFLHTNEPMLRKYDKEWRKLNRQLIFFMAAVAIQRMCLWCVRPFRRTVSKSYQTKEAVSGSLPK